MTVLFFMVVSLGFLIYGALVYKGIYTPIGSKFMVEDENRDAWCKSEGFTKILWGIDVAFLTMYLAGGFLPYLWLGCFLVLTIYIIILAYKNNQKYMK